MRYYFVSYKVFDNNKKDVEGSCVITVENEKWDILHILDYARKDIEETYLSKNYTITNFYRID